MSNQTYKRRNSNNVEEGHPLQSTWSLWFLRRVQGSRSLENYEKNVKKVATFETVEGFWRHYNYLLRPNDLPITSDYHIFKENIKPLWEDEANKSGGKWMARLKKGLASRCWEELLFAIIGEQFDVGDEICGAVISIRFQDDVISVWNRNSQNQEAKLRIHNKLKEILNIPNITLEYKEHDAALSVRSGGDSTTSAPHPSKPPAHVPSTEQPTVPQSKSGGTSSNTKQQENQEATQRQKQKNVQ